MEIIRLLTACVARIVEGRQTNVVVVAAAAVVLVVIQTVWEEVMSSELMSPQV